MKILFNQSGSIHILPLLFIIAAVGIISFLLISSTAPFKGGLFGLLNPRPASKAATSNIIDMAYPCGFTNPAFCDNFSEGPATVKGRANDLDFRKWSFARVTGHSDFNQSQYYAWGDVAAAEHCKQTFTNVRTPLDSFFCGSEVPEPEHWMESLDDHDSFAYNTARIRQPFDFSNRTGTIQFGVDAKNSTSHGWWLEVWITDSPIQGTSSHDDGGIGTSTSRNSVFFVFAGNCNAGANPPADFFNHGLGKTGAGVSEFRDYQLTDPSNPAGGDCVNTADDSSNMFQIKLSTTHAELWGSDNGSNVLKFLSSADFNPSLNFSKGYVNFAHVHYNPSKAGNGAAFNQTYHWHDMGFDGPVHPLPRVYEIPDATTVVNNLPNDLGNTSGVNVAYLIKSPPLGADGAISTDRNSTAKDFPAFTIKNVDLSNMASAKLIMSMYGFGAPGFKLMYQFNNKSWHEYDFPADLTWGPGLNFSPAIDGNENGQNQPIINDLVQGTNTLKFKIDTNGQNGPLGYSNTGQLANIDLELNPPDSATPAPASPMISCNLMNLMMNVMPGMVMVSDPCNGMTPLPTPTPSGTRKLGDINSDGLVDIFDYNILVGNFGKTVPVNTLGDLDSDGKVGIFDYNILVTNFGM